MAVDFLVIGLGNPGAQYARTRHNVGFECIERIARRKGVTLTTSKLKALVATTSIGGASTVLALPTTFMNESGQAGHLLTSWFKVDDPQRIIVVQDELDLDPGVVRIKNGGGLGGHNGLRSLTQHLSTQDYVRVRIGVGKPPSAARGADHVLKKVPPVERLVLDVAVEIAADAVEKIIGHGVAAAMADINRRQLET